jgi:hypothetical protein
MSVIQKPILPHPRNVQGPAGRADPFLVRGSVAPGMAQKTQKGDKKK